MKRSWLIFGCIFLLAAFSQSLIWHFGTFTDEKTWLARAAKLEQDLSNPPQPFDLRPYSQHPGTPVLLLAVLAHKNGLAYEASLRFAVSLINALAITAISLIAYRLKPHTLFWLVAAGVIAVHPLYEGASPVDAVLAPLLTALVLLLILYGEQPASATRSYDLWLAVGLSLSGATRIHFALLWLTLPVLLLIFKISWSRWIFIISLTVAGTFALIPQLWFAPLAFIQSLLDQWGFFNGASLAGNTVHSLGWSVLLYMPLAFLSGLIALWLYFQKASLPAPIKSTTLTVLLTNTIIVSSLLLLARLQSLRYFMPLIFIWEALLPLWLLSLWQNKQTISNNNGSVDRLVPLIIAALLIGGQLFLLTYTRLLPDGLS